MAHYIAVDGGGTKTELLLAQSDGRLLSRIRTGPSNPNDTSVEYAVEVVACAARKLLATALVAEEDCVLFAGIAGALNHRMDLEAALRRHMPGLIDLEVASDVQILLSSELPVGNGACIICGTGSACFLRLDGQIHRIGGWGYLLDSGGSGYDIGRDALEAALRDHDGRGPKTALSRALTDHLGHPTEQSITAIYEGGKPLIAGCARIVFDVARVGDPVANAILRRNARALSELIEAAYRRLTAGQDRVDTFPVVMGGGIGQNESMWPGLIRSLTDPAIPLALTIASSPPILGALLEAARLAVLDHDLSETTVETLRGGFHQTYSTYL